MINNIIFDYGGVLVQYDFAGFFGKLLGSRDKGEWFMDNVLPDEVNREMDRELHPFSFYIHRQQQRWPDYADALDYFDKHYTDTFTCEMPGMRQFMMELKEKGFHLYGLSNWSSKLSEVKDKFSIFSIIEKELVSKDVHLLKPDPSIYRAFLSKFSLDPASCLFIDDKQENINGCKAIGMNGFHFDSKLPKESIEAIKNLIKGRID